MKIKLIASACLALCASSVFAAVVYDPNTTSPVATYYMGGATAQLPGVTVIVPASLFSSPANVTWIYQGTAKAPNPNGGSAGTTFPANNNVAPVSAGNNVVAWYGDANTANTGVTGNLLVIYNANAGSNAGVAQILNTLGANPTAFPAKWTKVLTVGHGGALFTCTSAAPYVCSTNDAAHEVYTPINMALSDTYITEAAGGVITPGANGYAALSTLEPKAPTGLESFGLAVNPDLYLALQKAQGLAPQSATTIVIGGAAQPNVNSADYASLVSVLGVEGANAFDFIKDPLNTTDTNPIFIERRTNWSGTQSASEMFFLNQICNQTSGTYQNALDLGNDTVTGLPVFATTDPILGNGSSNGQVNNNTYLVENAGTGDVINALTPGKPTYVNTYANTNGLSTLTSAYGGKIAYGIGVVSLENTPKYDGTGFLYVKVDGVSPDWINNGGTYTTDPTRRASTISGAYKFAVEMNAYVKTTSTAAQQKIDDLVVKQLSFSNLHNLAGVSYLDQSQGVNASPVAAQQARYQRNGSNCAPLTNTKF